MEFSESEHKSVPLVINLMSKCKPNTWDAEVRANNTVSLFVKYLSKRSSFSSHSDLIKSITVWTFQIKQYLGCGGLLLKIPAKKNSGVFLHWLLLNVVIKNRYCRPIIIYSSILKPILNEVRQKF